MDQLVTISKNEIKKIRKDCKNNWFQNVLMQDLVVMVWINPEGLVN